MDTPASRIALSFVTLLNGPFEISSHLTPPRTNTPSLPESPSSLVVMVLAPLSRQALE